MAREKPNEWRCEHHYPIEVAPIGDERRARCLGCGACGPVRADSEAALRALKLEAMHGGKVGA